MVCDIDVARHELLGENAPPILDRPPPVERIPRRVPSQDDIAIDIATAGSAVDEIRVENEVKSGEDREVNLSEIQQTFEFDRKHFCLLSFWVLSKG